MCHTKCDIDWYLLSVLWLYGFVWLVHSVPRMWNSVYARIVRASRTIHGNAIHPTAVCVCVCACCICTVFMVSQEILCTLNAFKYSSRVAVALARASYPTMIKSKMKSPHSPISIDYAVCLILAEVKLCAGVRVCVWTLAMLVF